METKILVWLVRLVRSAKILVWSVSIFMTLAIGTLVINKIREAGKQKVYLQAIDLKFGRMVGNEFRWNTNVTFYEEVLKGEDNEQTKGK